MRSADGLVLVARRRAEQGEPVAVPGGKLESGETVEACAVRELAEETGLRVDFAAVQTFGCVFVDGWIVAGVEVRLDAVAADVATRELEPDKVGAFAWIMPAAEGGRELYPATAALLEQLPAA